MDSRPKADRLAAPQELDSFEMSVLQELHAREWFADKNSHLEYGRVLKAALGTKLGFECQNYMHRIDGAAKAEASREWALLRPLLSGREWESELFDWVVGLDADQLALTDKGEWLIRSDVALDLLRNERDTEKAARSGTNNFLLAIAIAAVAAIAIALLFG